MKPLKELDYASIELDDLYWEDYPDVPNGEIVSARWLDGTDLSEAEIAELHADTAFMYELLSEALS